MKNEEADRLAGEEREVMPGIAAVERMRCLIHRVRAIVDVCHLAVIGAAIGSVPRPANIAGCTWRQQGSVIVKKSELVVRDISVVTLLEWNAIVVVVEFHSEAAIKRGGLGKLQRDVQIEIVIHHIQRAINGSSRCVDGDDMTRCATPLAGADDAVNFCNSASGPIHRYVRRGDPMG